ncbi:hypothetical protein [Caballeronia sp. BR00000012568055]|uniref:hypothetical protein n=1 Tax=Caballeronia sp. BR00000012568055 TaxID=2918761 RepID=UPI0023F9E091
MFFSRKANRGRNEAARAAGVLLISACCIHAQTARSAASARRADTVASAANAASDPIASLLSADSLPPNFTGDNPVHVRDALTGHVGATAPSASITNRVRTFLTHPLQSIRKDERQAASATRAAGQSTAGSQGNRTFVFVVPAAYGVRFEAKRKVVSVDVSLASPETPDAILLRQTVKGQSGRKLVIAPEAKAKGFVQTFDTIQFRTDGTTKTMVRGRTLAPDLAHARNGDFAIVLICTLEPPYMTEQVDHSDPTDEEPTDITHRTSTLQGIVNAVWLIDRKDGAIVTKRLRLVK